MTSAALALPFVALVHLAHLALPAAAPGADGSPEARSLAARVQSTYERTKDLQADFTQTYTYSGFGRRQVSSGKLLVKKPGMMRWDYAKPTPKTVAVKGTRLVRYEPEEHQAYVDERFDAGAMSAAVTFLLGTGDLAKEFTLAVSGRGELVLRPREADPRVDSIALAVGPDGTVTETRVVDGAGNVNVIAFSNVKRNAGLPDKAFDVELPRDVVRIQAPKQAAGP